MPTGVPFPTPSAFRPFAARTTSSSSCSYVIEARSPTGSPS
jgi:hypothetical protein